MKAVNDFYVYAYFRPIGTPCYIGKGRRNRWLKHLINSHNPHLARIVAKAGGDLPKIKIRENLTDAEAYEIEIALIAAIGREANGGPLVNLTDGGEGLSNPSPEIREKIGQKLRGQKRTAEVCEKMGATHRGKPLSEAHRLKLRDALLGRTVSPETRAKTSARFKGKPLSPEHRAKLSAAKKGKPAPPQSAETRLKIRLAQLGKKRGPISQEHRNKIGAAHRGMRRGEQALINMRAGQQRRHERNHVEAVA